MTTTRQWKWCIGIYYALTILLLPSCSGQWPVDTDNLLFFGVIPLLASLVGLSTYRDQTQRVLSWMVFALAIGGIGLSCVAWRCAIGFPDWAATVASVIAFILLFSALILFE
jgi:hypothetical protein